jgi:hypothetical protein
VTVVYHVETHRNPRQIERLARALLVRTPDAVVVIDHDKRFEGPDRRVLDKLGAHLRLSDGGYGDMSHVYRWMQTAEWLASENISYTWMSNLTGQDYPIRPLDRVHAELAASPADAYIQTFDVLDADETHWGVARGRTRYEYSHRRLKRLSPSGQRALRPLQAVNLVQPWFRVTTSTGLAVGSRAKSPWGDDLVLKGGSFFCTLGARAVDAVLRFGKERPDVAQHLAHSIAPDEVYLQTALGWATDGVRAEELGNLVVIDDCRRYFDFSESTFNHPRTFTVDDLPAVFASGADLARKFDEAAHPGVLEAVDRQLADIAADATADAAADAGERSDIG